MQRARKAFWWPAVICLLLASYPALAGSPGAEVAVVSTVGGILELYVIIAVPIYTFTNLSYALDGERPPRSWITFGLIGGGLCVAGGVAWMFIAENNNWNDTFVAIGAGHFVLGALDIGITIWASSQPEKPDQKLTLTPIVMPDARGNATFGVGLRLVDW